jgi:hypothetical protein
MSCLGFHSVSSDVCNGLDAEESMGLRPAMRLSSFALGLILSVHPLQAQTARAHFTGPYNGSVGAVLSDSGAQATGAAQIGDAAAASAPGYAAYRHSDDACPANDGCQSSSSSEQQISSSISPQSLAGTSTDPPGEAAKASSALIAQHHERPDRNLDIYYRNRTEFSLDVGWHPINVPFIFDFCCRR